MQHQYNEMTNVRMPRACKARRGTGQQQQNVRQTRRTRAVTQHELLQQQQNAIYAAPPQVPDFSLYNMPDQRNMQPNNGFLPDVQLPGTTATYTQESINEQTMSYQQHTRRVIHSTTTCGTSHMERYWHAELSPPQMFHNTQPMPSPIARPKPQLKDASTQTDMIISDKELKLLKALRDEQIDVSKFYSIIEKSDYIVSFDQTESKDDTEDNNNVINETEDEQKIITPICNEIVNYNAAQQRNDVMTMAYIIQLQKRLATSMPTVNSLPAIEANPTSQTDVMTCPSPIRMDESLLSPGFFQNEQQDNIINEQPSTEQLPPQNACNNIQSSRPVNMKHTQPQVPPGFPLPNFMNQCMYNNQMRYRPPYRHGYDNRGPHFQQHPDNNNMNFFQAAAFFGQYYVRQMHQQRPRGWCPNQNMFPMRPPWM